MKLLKLKENKPIKEYEKEWETQKGYKTCDNCGTRLNDGGTCPKCDDGEENMDEAYAGLKSGSRESVQVLINSVDDPEEYEEVQVTQAFTTSGDFSKNMFDDGAPVMKSFSRGETTRLYDVKVPKNSWLAVSPIWSDVFRFNGKGWILLDDLPENLQEYTTYRVEPEDMDESLHKSGANYIAKETSYEIAKKIAETAKRALKLPEHEVEMLEHDINNLRANEWVDTFAKLSDKSEAKKLFFKYAVKVADEMDESLVEDAEKYATKEVTPCCICKQPIEGYGNNAEPVCKGTCCDKCNREKVIPARIDKFRGGLTESYNKIDEDTANEIALMAMSALSLKEHEAQALEYDLIEGNAGKWIKDFEDLPDNSEVKKLFFTFVKKSTNESYDPKDFNIDARTPFDDEMEKIYKPLATAIKEERWEDAAKEYWELKNEFDAELQSVSKKPIIGKLFKLMAIPHTNALNNYKKSIPAEYLEGKDKENESLSVGADIAGSSLKKSDSKVKKDYDDDFDLTVY